MRRAAPSPTAGPTPVAVDRTRESRSCIAATGPTTSQHRRWRSRHDGPRSSPWGAGRGSERADPAHRRDDPSRTEQLVYVVDVIETPKARFPRICPAAVGRSQGWRRQGDHHQTTRVGLGPHLGRSDSGARVEVPSRSHSDRIWLCNGALQKTHNPSVAGSNPARPIQPLAPGCMDLPF
jgi:hypothetical protein